LLGGRLAKIAVATAVLVVFGTPLLVTAGAEPPRAASGLVLFGAALSAFEEFYLQAQPGAWLMRLHPLASFALTTAAALAIAILATALNLALWGESDRLGATLWGLARHLHTVLLLVAGLALSLRTISFVGGRTLFHLLTGRYHRPVSERRVIAFIDFKGSTALVERLGPLRGREAIGSAVSSLSRLVIEHGGDVYLFTGDGLVATWDWERAVRHQTVLAFARAALTAVRRSAPRFERLYGARPGIRIGIHGGEVVVSQQGDLRRSIGIWGEVINVAARLEQAGKEVGRDCLLSEEVVTAIGGGGRDLEPLAPIRAKGVSHPITAYALKAEASG
jgi:class 3 adenylate cyclase